MIIHPRHYEPLPPLRVIPNSNMTRHASQVSLTFPEMRQFKNSSARERLRTAIDFQIHPQTQSFTSSSVLA